MRKIICIAVAVMTALLGGCSAGTQSDPLAYQSYPGEYECRVEGGGAGAGAVRVRLESPGVGKVEYTEPATLAGIVFSVGEGGVTLSCGDAAFTLNDDTHTADPAYIVALLSLDGNLLAGYGETEAVYEYRYGRAVVRTDGGGGLPLSVSDENGGLTLLFD